jgi:hypothetical protein
VINLVSPNHPTYWNRIIGHNVLGEMIAERRRRRVSNGMEDTYDKDNTDY